MRSLFAKTLLWFLATVAIAMVGITVTTAFTFRASESRQSPFNMLLDIQTEDAKRAYETGGPQALANIMARFGKLTDFDAAFTDSDARDLITGKLRPDLKKRMGQRHRRPNPFMVWMGVSRPAVIAHPDSTHRYYLFLSDTRRSASLFWFLQWQHLAIIGLVVLLCYAFAYHLTSPVGRLQSAVACFGHGDFSARAPASRRDELGQLARTFNEMADRIQTLLKAERRLLQDISHELRSPLARLGVAVELARSGDGGPATFDRIEREAERLNDLVGELLQVTRAEGDPSQRKKDPVPLEQILSGLVYDSEIEATSKGCKLALDAAQPATVLGDEVLLRRAIDNVLRNAIRYAPEASTVEVQLQVNDASAEISIRDFGPGVPEESLTRIFDAFYRVDSDRNRNSGGVGLGLAIARRAIVLHKGKLHAENAHPGLRVTIELPLAPVPNAPEKVAVLSTK
ncbi:MAG: HAMP domain-containing protein [Acidobacteriaceae bacterium]|nr:HAMP domain-containing protein [Acidobacteriaceae bacterium]